MRRARRNLDCPIEPLAHENAVRPSAARSDDEGDASEHRPRREAPCDEAERRPTRARSDPRPARVGDRAPAPPAPEEGWRACGSPLIRRLVPARQQTWSYL